MEPFLRGILSEGHCHVPIINTVCEDMSDVFSCHYEMAVDLFDLDAIVCAEGGYLVEGHDVHPFV